MSEFTFAEKPFLDRLVALDWTVIDQGAGIPTDPTKSLQKRGHACSLGGIFRHTGENDAYFGPYSQNNAEWMKQLIDRVRVDLDLSDIRLFITEHHMDAPWGNAEIVNSAMTKMAANDSRVTKIKTSDLPHAKHHFGTRGTLFLGETMADAFLANR